MKDSVINIQHAGGSGTSAHCDASRISAGIPFTSRAKASPKPQNTPQTLPKPFKIDPKSIQNQSKIDPEGLLEPILDQCLKKDGFRTPKKQPRSPKSAQETPKTLPDPSQMEPKTLPSLILMRFFTLYLPTPNLHRFFIGLSSIFGCFVIARNLDFRAPVEAKR